MPDTRQTAMGSDFWRCPKCATPNPAAAYVTNCLGCGSPRPARAVAVEPPPGARVVIRPVRGRIVSVLSWVYAAMILTVLGLIHGLGNTWWVVTVLLFMPRWLFLIPLVGLVVASGLIRSFWHWVLQIATAAIVAGPLMGFCCPIHQIWEQRPAGEKLRIATYNLGLVPLKKEALKAWIEQERLDVICFQEGGTDGERILPDLPEGWRMSPQSYLATRLPVIFVYPNVLYESENGGLYGGRMERLRLRTPAGREIVVASLHLPTIRVGIERLWKELDTVGLERITTWWSKQLLSILTTLSDSSDLPVLIGGDFNMPSDDSTMAALRSSFRFAFEEGGLGYGYTRPTRHPWIRIDHILTGPQWSVASCRVGPDFGSDHLPLIAEAVLPASTEPAPAKPGR